MAMVHTGEESHSCELCSASFRSASDLKHFCKNAGVILEKNYAHRESEESDICQEFDDEKGAQKVVNENEEISEHPGNNLSSDEMILPDLYDNQQELESDGDSAGADPCQEPGTDGMTRADFPVVGDSKRQAARKSYVCRICKKAFSLLKDLDRHSMAHKEEDALVCSVQLEYPPEECTARSKNPVSGAVDRSSKRIHTPRKGPYLCSICRKIFNKYWMLKRHLGSHTKPYQCLECLKVFSDGSNLKRHVAIVHDEKKPFQCNICNLCFSTASNLRRHYVGKHASYDSQEDSDSQQVIDEDTNNTGHFDSRDSNDERAARSAGNELCENTYQLESSFKCPQCSKVFSDSSSLRRHIVKIHDKKLPFACNVCDMSFCTAFGLRQHSMCEHWKSETAPSTNCQKATDQSHQDLNEKSREESICNKIVTQSKTLVEKIVTQSKTLVEENITVKQEILEEKMDALDRQHESADSSCSSNILPISDRKEDRQGCKERMEPEHSSGINEPLFCPICGKVFQRPKQLKRHSFNHTKPYKCTKCDKSFSDKCNLKHHALRVHKDGTLYFCQLCHAYFTSQPSLKEHVFTHARVPAKDSEDTRVFSEPSNSFEQPCNEFPDSSDSCPESSPSLEECADDNESSSRLENTLDEDNPHSCYICKEAFPTHQTLENHIQKHGESNNCPECGKFYSKRSNMKRHMAISHQITDVHCCDVCGKPFATSQALKSHVQSHIVSNNCAECGKFFSLRSNLKRHMTVVHKISHSCEVCGVTFATIQNLKQHLIVHTNEEKHVCTICKKEYLGLNDLQWHYLAHKTDEK